MKAKICCSTITFATTVQLCISGAADSDQRVVNSDVPWALASHIDLDDDRSRQCLSNCESYVLDSYCTDISAIANFDNWGRIGLAHESRAIAGDCAPAITNQASAGRDGDSAESPVDTIGQVRNLSLKCCSVQCRLQCWAIVSYAVALKSLAAVLGGVLQVDDIVGSSTRVLIGGDDWIYAAGSQSSRPGE